MAQRNTQPDAPTTRNLNFVVEIALQDRFREVAAIYHRTVSQELRHLMEQRIAEHDRAMAA